MINTVLKASVLSTMLLCGISQANASVFASDHVIAEQQHHYNKQQVLSFVDDTQVQRKLIELGVNPADAKNRIANMTAAELTALNTQLNEMPAGGVVGTILTVLVVVAVLDLMGITDVYPFIRPI